MKRNQDFKEFIKLLHDHNVQYLIVGGYAFAIHAEPRFTKDLDVFIRSDHHNASKLMGVLKDFGFGSLDLKLNDFTESDQVIQLGYAPLRIDILTGISGIEFDDAWKNKVVGQYDGQETYFIGKDDLRKNKLASGRPSDIVDAEKLK
ncbi:DUF6036 family nucleotidyltransferase [Rhodohalobacter halophilus]|uniref:DUF6036 family nucleotidyltransferase n=1 Tax=Rhodohalobacter halophilus TaxID=1812810 RepID=UPI00083F886B|nr:DUF6036 family nucleotidyltransferase [Rhodohalobacter halophilus]